MVSSSLLYIYNIFSEYCHSSNLAYSVFFPYRTLNIYIAKKNKHFFFFWMEILGFICLEGNANIIKIFQYFLLELKNFDTFTFLYIWSIWNIIWFRCEVQIYFHFAYWFEMPNYHMLIFYIWVWFWSLFSFLFYDEMALYWFNYYHFIKCPHIA